MGEPATSHSSNGRPVDNRRAGELKRKIWAVDHLMPGAGAVQVFNEVFDVGTVVRFERRARRLSDGK
jgi:hypothetical protein